MLGYVHIWLLYYYSIKVHSLSSSLTGRLNVGIGQLRLLPVVLSRPFVIIKVNEINIQISDIPGTLRMNRVIL
jgi:hypothetical protein